MAKALLQHDTGLTKEVKIGFSWTIFFFGFIALIIRGQVKEALIVLLTSWVGVGLIYWVYLIFKGNEKLREKYILEGYKIVGQK